ncbi:G-type lectin S-receptor-like serine/threonine-protein kinase At2g19130 [Tasmannia lanceolata]|uniref:G-type lectin S-receptor-like serine/threonine-protein kinase At2g19130 n=1 Tax=Tasmannia lanceolata TaxID=3420 RepID=UPI0040645880
MSIRCWPWFFLVFLFVDLSMAADTISPGQSLSGDQNITSRGGNFVLGFFSPGKSQKHYIGIWYNKVSLQTLVWVANRETPLPDTSSQLKISEDGNLVLHNQSNILIWSTNSTVKTSNGTIAILLDSGNLVLRDGSNSSVVFWQSFDHPTHTWLPGGQVGLNKITGENQLLTSWRSSDDPAPGPFSLEIDPGSSSQYLILWNRSQRYWSSGDWNGHIFSGVPEMRLNFLYNFNFTDNETVKYFTYSVYDPKVTSRFVMDLSGQIKQYTWLETNKEWNLFWSQPRDQCDVYSLCGPFGSCSENSAFCTCAQGFEPASAENWNLSDWSGGCVRKTPLKCGNNISFNGEKDRFRRVNDLQFPANQHALTVGSVDDCQSACLNNCSCTAYAYNSSGCTIWYGELWNLRQLSTLGSNGDLYLRLAASEIPDSGGKKKAHTGLIVGAAAGVIVVIMGILLVVIRKRCMTSSSKAVEGSLISYSYRDLQSATKNFSEKLGGGGFGSVFKGILPDSTSIAVKKLEGLRQGEKQFRAEVSTIGTIQHLNLIRLRGFCSVGVKRLLVYDYMPNGSLDSHLFQKKSKFLDWKTRYQIALGTARGLAYLHEKCRDCIVHCDIKPENILLDAAFCSKVADFGLAKLIGRDFSRALTTMRGTRGYLAPEWISGLPITSKADVYSYGMMFFEIISGRRNVEQSEDGKIIFFPTWAAKKITEGKILSLVDYSLEGNVDMEELNRACRVACWCIQDDEEYRPSMGQVVQILEGVLEVNMPPIPRALQIFVENQENVTVFSESSSDRGSQTRSSAS